jgi:hypothetical protein
MFAALAAMLVLELIRPWDVSLAIVLVPAGIAALRLPRRAMVVVALASGLTAAAMLATHATAGRTLMLLLVLGMLWLFVTYAASRERVGINAFRGFDALVQLSRGTLDVLQERADTGWEAAAAVSPSRLDAFRGDFLIGQTGGPEDPAVLGVVDVSGHGIGAAVRAVGLAGAVNALAGTTPVDQVLRNASRYVASSWQRGEFATAALVEVEPRSGTVVMATAGHPAGLIRRSTGQWAQPQTSGPALGMLPDPAFETVTDRLGRGDSVVLFSDGLVESQRLDLDAGTRRLMRMLEKTLASSAPLDAQRILQAVCPDDADDASLLVVRRL